LLLEIDQALESRPDALRDLGPLTEWADGPADNSGVLELVIPADPEEGAMDWPQPAFGEPVQDGPPIDADGGRGGLDQDMGLADWLASAREFAQAAKGSEERSRQALYAAIGRAYDFSIAAAAAPAEFAELVADAGLTMQDRAPMTP